MKICSKCNEPKIDNQLAIRYDEGKRTLRGTCKVCRSDVIKKSVARPEYKVKQNASRNAKWKIKTAKVKEYLSHNSCVDCDESDVIVLQFDHVRGNKLFTIGKQIRDRPWESILLEIKKCDIRCVNCHLRRTYYSLGYGKRLYSRPSQIKAANYLSNNPCVDCGEDDPIVLQFDHVRGDKIGCVSELICRKWKIVFEEIKKCDVRCGNCHTRKTVINKEWQHV